MTDAVRAALAEILELCAIGDVDECTEALGWGKAIQRARAALSEQPSPIDMVLHCPVCGVQHIDAPESHPVFVEGYHVDDAVLWGNPPHRSHLCHGCGHIWRPADVATNGVAAIKTRGKNDSPMGACAHPVAHPAPVERVALSEGELWSFVRSVMSQGADIRCDYDAGRWQGHEQYSARLDAAASERADELLARLNGISATPRQPLSEAQIAAVLRKASERAGFVTLEAGEPSAFMVGVVRDVEAAHGITPAQGKGGE